MTTAERVSPNLQAFDGAGNRLGTIDPDPDPGVWVASCEACANRYRTLSIEQAVAWIEHHDHTTGLFTDPNLNDPVATVTDTTTPGGTNP